MKIAKRSADNPEYRVGASSGITKENYLDRARAFIRGNGGNGFVIRAFEGFNGALNTNQPATEAQWIAWGSYFAEKEIPFVFGLANGLATVPCEWPESFDAELYPSDRSRTLPRKVLASREKREAVSQGYANLLKRMALYRPNNRVQQTPDEILADLSAWSHRTPIAPLSSLGPSKSPDSREATA